MPQNGGTTTGTSTWTLGARPWSQGHTQLLGKQAFLWEALLKTRHSFIWGRGYMLVAAMGSLCHALPGSCEDLPAAHRQGGPAAHTWPAGPAQAAKAAGSSAHVKTPDSSGLRGRKANFRQTQERGQSCNLCCCEKITKVLTGSFLIACDSLFLPGVQVLPFSTLKLS